MSVWREEGRGKREDCRPETREGRAKAVAAENLQHLKASPPPRRSRAHGGPESAALWGRGPRYRTSPKLEFSQHPCGQDRPARETL